ncbi:hypothetical protein OAF16_01020 [Flavobacteriales bacterium]|nr:hypothetical protein [Flavobacteriales bacterium]
MKNIIYLLLPFMLFSCSNGLKLNRDFKKIIKTKNKDKLNENLLNGAWYWVNEFDQQFVKKMSFGLKALEPYPFDKYVIDDYPQELYVYDAKGDNNAYLEIVDLVFDVILTKEDPVGYNVMKGLYVCCQWQEGKDVLVLIYD